MRCRLRESQALTRTIRHSGGRSTPLSRSAASRAASMSRNHHFLGADHSERPFLVGSSHDIWTCASTHSRTPSSETRTSRWRAGGSFAVAATRTGCSPSKYVPLTRHGVRSSRGRFRPSALARFTPTHTIEYFPSSRLHHFAQPFHRRMVHQQVPGRTAPPHTLRTSCATASASRDAQRKGLFDQHGFAGLDGLSRHGRMCAAGDATITGVATPSRAATSGRKRPGYCRDTVRGSWGRCRITAAISASARPATVRKWFHPRRRPDYSDPERFHR